MGASAPPTTATSRPPAAICASARDQRVETCRTLRAEGDDGPDDAELARGHGGSRMRRQREGQRAVHPHRPVLAEERRLRPRRPVPDPPTFRGRARPGETKARGAEMRVIHRQARGGDGELAEATRGPRLESRHELAGAEVRDLRRDAHRILADVEARDGLERAATPRRTALHIASVPTPGGRHDPEAGDHDPAARRALFAGGCLASQPSCKIGSIVLEEMQRMCPRAQRTAGADLHAALGNGGSQWASELGHMGSLAAPAAEAWRSVPRALPGTPGSQRGHPGTAVPMWDRMNLDSTVSSVPGTIAARRLLLPRGSSRLPRSLSGIQTSRPRPVPSPDSRTGSGAGATPTRATGRPRARARRGSIRPECLDPPLRHLPQTRRRRCLRSRDLGEWHARCSWSLRAAGILPRSAGR